MTPLHRFLLRYGMAGLPFDASSRLHVLEHWLSAPLFAVLFLAIPAFYIELSAAEASILSLGWWFILAIALGFATHLAVMLALYPHRLDYLRRNWMHVLIVVGATLNLTQVGTPDSWLDWVLRLVWQGTAFIRLTGFLTGLVRPGGLGGLLFMAMLTLAGAGGGFYWLEPTVHTYGEGIWLAFISAATVGYGDYFPTTDASRAFAVFIVLFGYALLSLVMAKIAALLVGEEEKELRRDLHRDIRALRGEISELRRVVESLPKERDDAPR